MRINNCRLIDLPIINDARGNLSFVEQMNHVPFEFKRIYYLYDVPGGSFRGAHAHKNLHQFLFAASGSFDIHLDDGVNKKSFSLNRAYQGVYICPMIWRKIDNFSSGSVCMVISSELYDKNDYIRSYDHFLVAAKK
jgi:hypothetical protein